MPFRYYCMATKPPAGTINGYVDSAVDDDDAIRQFREMQNLDVWEKNNPTRPPIQVEAQRIQEIPGSANQMATEAEALPVAAAPEVSSPSPQPVTALPGNAEIEQLKPFGISDRQVAALRLAKLTTIDAVVNYAKAGGRIGNLPDLQPIDEALIKKAIKAARGN